jgi:hypothetical protein
MLPIDFRVNIKKNTFKGISISSDKIVFTSEGRSTKGMASTGDENINRYKKITLW